MGWFGNLDLAFKYAIVFGSALAITLLAGVLKLFYDRYRMAKFIRDNELEAGPKEVEEDEKNLNTGTNDEGDLFGIRAIEAGFYGGVHQSRPNSVVNSVVNSPVGSRPTSPTLSSVTLGPGRTVNDRRTFSATSSVLSLSQFQRESNIPDVVTPSRDSAPPRNLSDPIEVHHPMGYPSSSGFTHSAKLRPSQAELSGRINHAPVDMSLEVPPSPTYPTTPDHRQQYHQHSQQHYQQQIHHQHQHQHQHPLQFQLQQQQSQQHQPHAQFQSRMSQDTDDDLDIDAVDPPSPTSQSRNSAATSAYQYPTYDTQTMPEVPQLAMPEHIGKTVLEISVADNPHSGAKSLRASIVSKATTDYRISTDSSTSKAPPLPPIPLLNLPAFPKKAVIDSSSPLFRGFVKERSLAKDVNSSRESGVNHVGLDTAANIPPPVDEEESEPDHASTINGGRSPRTSFSFCNTDPDAYLVNPAFLARHRIGERPMSTLNHPPRTVFNNGLYQPSGNPTMI